MLDIDRSLLFLKFLLLFPAFLDPLFLCFEELDLLMTTLLICFRQPLLFADDAVTLLVVGPILFAPILYFGFLSSCVKRREFGEAS